MPRARLTPHTVTEAGAALADEVGYDHLSMGLLAERLGVKTPALYKHVTGQADLAHRIAVLAMTEFADAIRDATQGRAGTDALTAGAHAMRTYVLQHPGRYAAGDAAARATGPDDPIIPAVQRVVASWAAMLRGYHLDPSQEIHAMRMLRSVLHGFSTLEAAGGFQIDAPVDDSFTWMIDFLDRGLHTVTHTPATAATPSDGH
jgi:AcrR family transcriptional regulator